MSAAVDRVLDVSGLTEGTADSRALLWWGNLGMMTIEGTMFAMMIATYLYMRTVNLDWPPATVQPPKLGLPTFNLVMLMLSVFPMIFADLGAKYDHVGRARIGFAICILVALVFLGIRTYVMATIGFKWSDHAYGSVIWTILALHIMHTVIATGEMGLLFVYMLFRPLTKKKLLDVRCTAIYWYFVIVSWLPFYFIVYIVPHLSRKG